MAAPVLLISSDPFLGASLDAIARGRIRLARLDPAHRPAGWPGEPGATVVLDVFARQRDAAYAWVRRHHAGPLVVLLKPGERDPALPPDPDRLVIRRPFRLNDLVTVLEHPPPRSAPEHLSTGSPPPPGPEAPAPPPPPGSAPPAEEAAAGPDRSARDLLTASAEQRRRRLGSLVASAPAGQATAAGAPPAADPGLPRPDWPTAATRLDVGRRRPRAMGGGRVAGRLLVALAILLAVAGAWLAFGLLEARQDLIGVAGAVRAELTRAETALQRGDPATARTAVRAAAANLDVAAGVPERRELRVAARLPVLSGVVGDARHLLAAARGLVDAGERAAAVAHRLRPGPAAAGRAGRAGRIDLAALDAAAGQARRLLVDLERSRAELDQVRGGPLAPGAAESKRWALGRVAEARARARALVPTLEALPAALGADRPRTYLVVLTDLAAPGPSGGGPLAGVELVLDGGTVAIRPGGGELAERLDDAGAAGDFATAARRLLGAGPARPDAVVALDPLGARALLEATGPIDVPGWGRLDGAGAAPGLTRGGGFGRADRELLLGTLLGRVLAGQDLVATGRALGDAGARGHLRVYAADAGLRRVLAHHRLDGAPAAGPR